MSDDFRARLGRIVLRNIKSFRDGVIEPGEGITVISGHNGAGKSTVIEAVGFALFGVPARDFIGNNENFVHMGARGPKGRGHGHVEIEYAGADGVDYKISRSTRGGADVFRKSSNGWFPLEIKDPYPFVAKTLGINSSIPLKDQFSEIIGPFQWDFVTPFLDRGSNRESRFNKILGIDQWQNLYQKTQGVDGAFNREIKTITDETALLEDQISDLPKLEADLTDAEKLTENLVLLIKEITGKIEQTAREISLMEQIKEKLSESRAKSDACRERLSGIGKNQCQINERMEEAQKSLKIAESSLEGYRRYEEAQILRKELEIKRLERDKIREEAGELEAEIRSVKSVCETRKLLNEKEASRTAGAKEQIKREMETLKESIKDRSLLLNESKEIEDEIIKLQQKLEPLKSELILRACEKTRLLLKETDEIREKLKNKERALEELEPLKPVALKLDEKTRELESLNGSISALKGRIKEAERGRGMLLQGVCPFLAEECKNLEGKDPTAVLDGLTDELLSQKDALIKIKPSLEKEAEHCRKCRDRLLSAEEIEKSATEDSKKIQRLEADAMECLKPESAELFRNILRSLSEELSIMEDADGPAVLDFYPDENPVGNLPSALSRMEEYGRALERLTGKITDKIKDRLNRARRESAEIAEKLSALNQDMKNQERQLKKEEIRQQELDSSIKQNRMDLEKLELSEKRLIEIKENLKPFLNLDENLSEVDGILQKNLESHRLYLTNQGAGQKLESLTESAKQLTDEWNECKAELERLETLQKEQKEAFNQDHLEELKELEKQLTGQKAGMIQQSSDTRLRLSELKERILSKKAVQKRIEKLLKKTRELEESRSFSAFLRKAVINEVGPRVSEILRDEVSGIANDAYQMISRQNEELYWGDNYSVELHSAIDGEHRVRRDQQLSGGQLTSAVIALRLALLQMVGSPFAFFDEPTSNLDQSRRENLADVFRNLNDSTRGLWYRQLFIISHDESFMDITRNLIRLKLEKGCTIHE